jgi:hypothetical protein
LIQIVKLESLEVTQKEVSRKFIILQTRKVIERLALGFLKASSYALLLYEEHAFPEQVHKPTLFAKCLDRLLEACDSAYWDAEHIEEVAVEKLGLPFS